MMRTIHPRDPQFIGTVGIVRDPEGVPGMRVLGMNGRSDYCTGLTINGNTIERLPGESWDDLVARVRRDPVVRGEPGHFATAIYADTKWEP